LPAELSSTILEVEYMDDQTDKEPQNKKSSITVDVLQ
jgi:hypothetical protein